jgi:DNA-binding SARP family transcriptional activator/TolB-like protein
VIDIQLLGTLTIAPDPEGLARQSKRAALLAYLLLTPGFQRRDRLLATFWPELDAGRARNALSQALHVLRRSLGDDAIVTHGDDVALNPGRLRCDVAAFEAAMERGALEEAMALYRGQLLDGFFVSGAPDFETRIEQERRRLRDLAGAGAWALSLAKAKSRDADDATRWARFAFGNGVVDEARLRGVAGALVDGGHRIAALRLHDEFAAWLEQEFQLEPSPETRAVVADIRASDVRRGEVRSARHTAVPFPSLAASQDPRFRRSGRRRLAASLLALAAIGVLAVLIARRDRWPGVDGIPRLAIMPVRNIGAAEHAYFADGVTEEIRNRVAQAGGLTVVAGQDAYREPRRSHREIARLLDAKWVLDGSASWQPLSAGHGRLRVRIELTSAADDVPPWANVFESDIAEMTQLSDLYATIAQRVVNELDIVLRTDRVATSSVTTNLDAYELYLQGRSHLMRSATALNHSAAIGAFRRAIALDPDFASAYAYLGDAYTLAHWVSGGDVANLDSARVVLQQALTLDPDLPEAHTTFGHLLYVCCEDYPGALGHIGQSLAARPDDARLHMTAGNVYKRKGDMAKAVAEYERASQLDPLYRWPRDNLGHAQLWMRRYAEAEHTFRDVISREPQNPFAHVHLALARVLRSGDVKGARRILDEASRAAEGMGPVRLGYDLAMMSRDYAGALAILRAPEPGLTRSLLDEWLVSDRIRGALARLWSGDSAGARASCDSARIELTNAPRVSRRDTLWLRSGLAIALAGLRDSTRARDEIAFVRGASPLAVDAIEGPKYLLHAALALVLLRDYAVASEIIAEVMRNPAPVSEPWLRALPLWDGLREHASFESVGVARRF